MSSITGANLGFEDKLWAAADKLRGTMDSAEYKHVVLGLIFLKYISDSFLEKYEALQSEEFADPEDRDEYLADNVFWVPTVARWRFLQNNAKNPKIGQLIDEAMTAIERDNGKRICLQRQQYAVLMAKCIIKRFFSTISLLNNSISIIKVVGERG